MDSDASNFAPSWMVEDRIQLAAFKAYNKVEVHAKSCILCVTYHLLK